MIYRDSDFIYDSETGKLVHAKDKCFMTKRGDMVGGKPNSAGYLRTWYYGKIVSQHRLIWKMVHGYWPKEIDHINGNRTDNRLSNLRECDRATNNRNTAVSKRNTSGVIGVSWYKETGKWRSNIKKSGKQIHLGLFDSLLDAVAARKSAERELGFHRNHGRRA